MNDFNQKSILPKLAYKCSLLCNNNLHRYKEEQSHLVQPRANLREHSASTWHRSTSYDHENQDDKKKKMPKDKR